jgi:hypothetical protein
MMIPTPGVYRDWGAPEKSLEPPEPECEFCPDCGGEVYEGDVLIQWEPGGEYICPDCIYARLHELERDPEALASVIGGKTRRVHFERKCRFVI